MGQSSSTEQEASPELREVQSLAASTGALPCLQKTFSLLSDPQTQSIPLQSLQNCFELNFESLEFEEVLASKVLPVVFSHLGARIVELFFVVDEDGVNWIEFLRGYTKCCARAAASKSLNNLFRVFSTSCLTAGLPVNLQFELCEEDCKISGMLSPRDVQMLLWICWMFTWGSKTSRLRTGRSKMKCNLPNISYLVASAIESCTQDAHKLDLWESIVSDIDVLLPAKEIYTWALKTLPNLADCLVQFVHDRVSYIATDEEKLEPPCFSANEISSPESCDAYLLNPGRAWAISLSLRSPEREEILNISFPTDIAEANDLLLYRSSLHGKGINRFWSNVEGYNGPVIMLIAACEDKTSNKWTIGALTNQGFENKDVYYGTSGSLYALCPVFHALSSSGREKNFVYTHLHATKRAYDPNPKPVGIAFGGSLGNERIFIDEDFSKVTLRHHAVDKTYQHEALLFNQGFLPVEASVLEVEVWGLGGKASRKTQESFQKREQLFTEQRRKVDLKNFSNWEDSPEKMMMDMMSNPNAVRRDDR